MTTEHTMEYDLTSVGLAKSVNVLGNLTILKSGKDGPVLFLIDERHEPDCIEQNVFNARALVAGCNVSFAGVESEYGGYEWDQYDEKYLDRCDPGNRGVRANDYPGFASELKNSNVIVFGVECHGLSGALERVKSEQKLLEVGNHPLNVARSEHFIRTLFQLRLAHRLDGNMILNVGGNHNTHIAQWIGDGSIETKAGQKAAYVRLRAPAYKE